MNDAQDIVERLTDMEREWILGWQGPGGAAFNCVAMDLYQKGLLCGPADWRLSKEGEAVKALLEKQNG